jgi:hypothetical protein
MQEDQQENFSVKLDIIHKSRYNYGCNIDERVYMATKNDTNFWEFLKSNGRNHLPAPDHQETLDELIAEGDRLLKLDEKKTTPPAPKPTVKKPDPIISNAPLSKNPYVRARTKVLMAMPEGERKVIEKMEKGELPQDSRYERYVKAIMTEGDKFSV